MLSINSNLLFLLETIYMRIFQFFISHIIIVLISAPFYNYMLLTLLCSTISYRFFQNIEPNQSINAFSFYFGFRKNGHYSIFITNGGNDSFVLFIMPYNYSTFQNTNEINKICSNYNGTQNLHENVHVIHLQNGKYSISSIINNEGIYKTSINSCSDHHEGFKIEGIYMNPNSPFGYDAQKVLKYLSILIYVRIIIFIAWNINWIWYFSMKNKLHLILTLTAFIFIITRIIDYFDYRKAYESNQISKISIIRPYFDKFRGIFLTNTFFLINCCYYIEKKPKVKVIHKLLFLWCFYLKIFPLLQSICNIYCYYIIGFLIHFIVNDVIILMSGIYYDDDFFIFLVNELKSLFYMLLTVSTPDKNSRDIFSDFEGYLVFDIYVLIFQCIIAYFFRMRKYTKEDYSRLFSPVNENVTYNIHANNPRPFLFERSNDNNNWTILDERDDDISSI